MKRDRISGLFFLLLSIGICAGALRLNIGTFSRPAEGSLPFLSGALIGVVSLWIMLRSFILEGNHGERDDGKEINVRKVFYVLGILIGCSLTMTFLGFVATTFLLFISLFWAVERMTWWKALLGSAGATLASYIFFVRWLQCQFPPGFLGY